MDKIAYTIGYVRALQNRGLLKRASLDEPLRIGELDQHTQAAENSASTRYKLQRGVVGSGPAPKPFRPGAPVGAGPAPLIREQNASVNFAVDGGDVNMPQAVYAQYYKTQVQNNQTQVQKNQQEQTARAYTGAYRSAVPVAPKLTPAQQSLQNAGNRRIQSSPLIRNKGYIAC